MTTNQRWKTFCPRFETFTLTLENPIQNHFVTKKSCLFNVIVINSQFARFNKPFRNNNRGNNNHVDTPTLQPYNFTTNGHQLTKPVPIESPEKDLSIGTGLVSWWSVLRKLRSVKVVTQNMTNGFPPLFLCKCANPEPISLKTAIIDKGMGP